MIDIKSKIDSAIEAAVIQTILKELPNTLCDGKFILKNVNYQHYMDISVFYHPSTDEYKNYYFYIDYQDHSKKFAIYLEEQNEDLVDEDVVSEYSQFEEISNQLLKSIKK